MSLKMNRRLAACRLALVFFLLGMWAIQTPLVMAQSQTLTGWFSFTVADYPSESGLTSEITYILTEDSGARHELLIDIDLMRPLGGPVALNRKRVTVIGEWEQREADTIEKFRVNSIELAVSLDGPLNLQQNLTAALPNTGAVELEALDCSLEDSLVSSSAQATTIFFDNQTPEPRYVYWLNHAGQRVLYITLPPRGSYAQETYAGNVWIITDEDDRCLSLHEAIAAPGKVTLKEPLSGSQAWVTILCRFGDATSITPHPISQYQDRMGSSYPALGHYWREVSDGNIPNLSGSMVKGWYNLPQPRSYYVYDKDGDGEEDSDLNRALEDCTAAADADVSFPDFWGINLIFNQDLDGASRGGGHFLTLDGEKRFWGVTWIQASHVEGGYHTVVAHEMGHAMGLQHSSGPYGQDDPKFSPTTYDSAWDVMSRGGSCMFPDPQYGCVGVHTIAYHKDFLGWIPANRKYVAPPNSTRTITLERLAQPDSEGYLMAQIPIGDSETDFYTVEARLFAGYDEEIPDEAVVIHKVDTTREDRLAQVVDIDNNGDPNDEGAMWTPGEIFTDVETGLQISIDAAYASGYRVTINTDPATFSTCIDFLSASSHVFGPGRDGASVQVTAASDCAWSATSNAEWLRITSGGTGSGSGRVRYTVAANPRPAVRTGTLTIDGWTFTVTQAGASDTVFEDNMESGTGGWTEASCEPLPCSGDSPWALTSTSSRSGTQAWTDSPGGHYQNNQNVILWSPIIDLTGVASATLTFWQRYDFAGSDQGGVWIAWQQEDGSWRTETHLRSVTGTQPTWQQTSLDLRPFVGARIRLAFGLWSDATETADGWYIDDVAVFSTDFVSPVTLENPRAASFQSGVGVISGWACHAHEIVIELDGRPFKASYGTEREAAVERICGHRNAGFSLLWNWNNLGAGPHTVRALIDGVEFANTTVRVTTFGEDPFPRGWSGTFDLPDFPASGETTVVQWEESLQNFVITDGQPNTGGGYNRVSGIDAILENPSLGSAQSGLGVISGWACEAEEIVIELNGRPLRAAYGTEREAAVERRCGHSDAGFSLLWNWNNLGPGTHTVRVLIDGQEFANTTVRVTTFGKPFRQGLSGTFPIPDFPRPGETKRLRWEQSLQNFVIIP